MQQQYRARPRLGQRLRYSRRWRVTCPGRHRPAARPADHHQVVVGSGAQHLGKQPSLPHLKGALHLRRAAAPSSSRRTVAACRRSESRNGQSQLASAAVTVLIALIDGAPRAGRVDVLDVQRHQFAMQPRRQRCRPVHRRLDPRTRHVERQQDAAKTNPLTPRRQRGRSWPPLPVFVFVLSAPRGILFLARRRISAHCAGRRRAAPATARLTLPTGNSPDASASPAGTPVRIAMPSSMVATAKMRNGRPGTHRPHRSAASGARRWLAE